MTDDFKQRFKQNLEFIHQLSFSVEEINALFEQPGIITHRIGEVDFPTGKVAVADPLCYLGNDRIAPPLNRTIPTGSYPVDIGIYFNESIGLRITAARLKVNSDMPVRYEIAMPDGHDISDLDSPGVIAGFGVDAGLACYCDYSSSQEYVAFMRKFNTKYPDGNPYDDYFAQLFKDSYEKYPGIQRPDGDFIEWALPSSGNRLVMFATGFGDGFYSSHYGFGEDGNICELVIPFMNPAFFI